MVRCMSERIEYKTVQIFQMSETVFRHIAHVCHICKSSDAEAYYGHLTMHYPNGQNAYASDVYTLARPQSASAYIGIAPKTQKGRKSSTPPTWS